MKRQRGRGRKPGGPYQANRTFESSGPDIKVRGPAPVVYEKYLQLARDANSSGDRVMAENYLQHAEHYFRLMRAMQPAHPPPQHADRFTGHYEAEDSEGGEETEADLEADGEAESPERPPHHPAPHHPAPQHSQPRQPRAEHPHPPRRPREDDGGEDEAGRRRRPRRSRFRPDAERSGDAASGGEEKPAEGFGDAAPAFLAGE